MCLPDYPEVFYSKHYIKEETIGRPFSYYLTMKTWQLQLEKLARIVTNDCSHREVYPDDFEARN